MEWNFEHNTLKRDTLTIKEFTSPLKKILDFKNCAVVLLDRDFYEGDNENVFCISESGGLLWQVPKFEYSYERSRFVDILKDSQNAKLFNWDSSWTIIEPTTGQVITTPRESRKGRRPW
jgi:hypothetical protein